MKFHLLSEGNYELLLEKILSIVCHLTNTHHFPENELYMRCSHNNINRNWLERGSKVEYICIQQFICISSLKAVEKVNSAIWGRNGLRLDDLRQMTGTCDIICYWLHGE